MSGCTLPSPRRGAFTLVELLAVMTLVGVLVALLLPAVQQAREASRQAKCTNNLHQIAIAMQNYHDSFRSFPSGYVLAARGYDNTLPSAQKPSRDSDDMGESLKCEFLLANGQDTVREWACMGQAWGWHALLLEQMGQATIGIDFSAARFNLGNVEAGRTPIESYTCPSARVEESCLPQGMTQYRGNMGWWDTPAGAGDLPPNNGIFFQDSAIRLGDITDGVSSTFLVGESQFGLWPDGYSCCVRVRRDKPHFDSMWRGSQQQPIPSVMLGFGSWHGAVLHFAMADGATRKVSKQIDPDLFRYMCTRYGNERVEINWN